MGTNLIVLGIGFVNSVILSRWLQPEGRGELNAALLWAPILFYLTSSGLVEATVYAAAQAGAKLGSIFTNALVLTGLLSLIIVPPGYWAMPWLLNSQSSHVVEAARLYLLVIPMLLMVEFNRALLQGRMRIWEINILVLILPVGYLLGTVGLGAIDQLSVHNIVLLHLGVSGLRLLWSFAALKRAEVQFDFRQGWLIDRSLLRYGSQVHIGAMSYTANMRLDQVLLAAFSAAAQLGLYVVAVSTASTVLVLSQAVRIIVVPAVVKHTNADDQVQSSIRIFRAYWVASLLVTLPLAPLFYWAVPFVYGNSFRGAIWPTEILLLGSLIVGAKDILGACARALNSPWLFSKAELVSAVLTVCLLVVLVPILGIVGAAVASTVAYGAALLVVVRGLSTNYGISPKGLFQPDREVIHQLRLLLIAVRCNVGNVISRGRSVGSQNSAQDSVDHQGLDVASGGRSQLQLTSANGPESPGESQQ